MTEHTEICKQQVSKNSYFSARQTPPSLREEFSKSNTALQVKIGVPALKPRHKPRTNPTPSHDQSALAGRDTSFINQVNFGKLKLNQEIP